MTDGTIAARASFDRIRYAQAWEDADVLIHALQGPPGRRFVSIAAAGDNALALLTLDPERVIAVDLSDAQLECVRVRMAAYRVLAHDEFLELFGARAGDRRSALLDRVLADLPPASQAFWQAQRADVLAWGLGGVGKFERYFRIFRRFVLPLVHGQGTIDDVFVSRPRLADRAQFYATRWNTWRWRLMLRLFFSRWAMGRLGRDPAFFDHVQGSVADHVGRRVAHAAVTLDPASNPYLHWILKGGHGSALPLAWRAEHFETIRTRLDRIELRREAIETFAASGLTADGFNLSDIYEYMDVPGFEATYGTVVGMARPGARMVYWNMMAPRRLPARYADRAARREDLEAVGKAMDKAFFYSDFVVEQIGR